ncbi:4-hydroxybenzoate polyprenyltransferase [Allocatelliglobosispora scoriae]|uniref:4-hydroxybenzoate polyprenyltransferase n=1 Tax=Allocatelliglobosispora scoriae TaxID=643052 RepID=A0A841BJ26_9ACTN|nr:UbiA family prenyltransferase [Allocatelliglobosispora scoriae]MBB5869117.1 4-hydroxybenzoate polyprenyltransferase [Allocatelliglobosispora scoriae]
MILRDLIELVRAPAALSVPGDAVAGAAAADCLDGRTAGIAAASVCLYWAGMAANDWSDRELDAVERPERPIPSGRISPGQALAVAGGLTAAGLAIAGAAGGRRTLATAGLLVGAIWTYDVKLKNSPAGPAGMAVCRGLDVLLGASTGSMRRALRPAAVVAAHTYAVTALSRREVSGADRALPLGTLAATAVVATAAARRPPNNTNSSRVAAIEGGPGGRATTATTVTGGWSGAVRDAASGLVGLVLAGLYAQKFGRAQRAVLRDPAAGNVRAAVGAGIMSLPSLQGALAAQHGSPVAGAAVAVMAPLGRRLVKAVSPT